MATTQRNKSSGEPTTETTVETDIDLDDEVIEITTVETRTQTVADLFEGDELVLWSDRFGWSGFEREDGEFFECNYIRDGEHSRYLERDRVDAGRVVEKIERHIEDEHAGGVGRFQTRCSPP